MRNVIKRNTNVICFRNVNNGHLGEAFKVNGQWHGRFLKDRKTWYHFFISHLRDGNIYEVIGQYAYDEDYLKQVYEEQQ